MSECIVVFVTVSSRREAKKVIAAVIKAKLVACVNVVPGIESTYWWQGKVEKAKEFLLIMKTKRTLFKKLVVCVKNNHSYTVPEIIALPITAGNPDYLKWIEENTNR